MLFLYDVKLQIAAIVVTIYILLNYSLAKRAKSYQHRVFMIALIDAIVYLVFDIVTVYTVNHLEQVPHVLNRICHNIYLTSMTFFLVLVFVYSYIMVKGDAKVIVKSALNWMIPWLLMVIAIWIVPLDYIKGEHSNYSMGPAAYITYISVLFYFFLACNLLVRNRKSIDVPKKRLLFIAYGTQFIVLIIQAAIPDSLITSIAIIMILMAFYMTVESPDVHMIELLKAEKQSADKANRAKSDFLARMSHEIRTPINGIMGLAELIKRETNEKHSLKYAMDIEESTESLLGIINEILDSSKIESGKMQICPTEYKLQNVFNDLHTIIAVKAAEKGIKLVFDIAEDLPDYLEGDDLRIKQVLLNLLTNGVKYTPKGEVKLTVCIKEKKEQSVILHFQVSDTGIGIKEENIPKLFASFERIEESQTRYVQGTGLGMSITTQLLKLMGSELKVQSVYGQGSEFSFELQQNIVLNPVLEEKEEWDTAELKENPIRYQAPNAKVLIVDDNEINLKVFRGLLKQTKIQVFTAISAAEGLIMLKDQDFDMIFLDHMMPEMDGIEMFHKMKQESGSKYDKTPIIMLSANAIVGAKEKYLEIGFSDFLSKPVLPEKLDKLILKYLPEELISYLNS